MGHRTQTGTRRALTQHTTHVLTNKHTHPHPHTVRAIHGPPGETNRESRSCKKTNSETARLSLLRPMSTVPPPPAPPRPPPPPSEPASFSQLRQILEDAAGSKSRHTVQRRLFHALQQALQELASALEVEVQQKLSQYEQVLGRLLNLSSSAVVVSALCAVYVR